MACAPPRNCGLPLVDPGGPQPARHRLKPTPCGRLAALRCSLTTRPLRVEESPARGPPLLNGHQERCLPRNSNPLHCADPCSAELPKRLASARSFGFSELAALRWEDVNLTDHDTRSEEHT